MRDNDHLTISGSERVLILVSGFMGSGIGPCQDIGRCWAVDWAEATSTSCWPLGIEAAAVVTMDSFKCTYKSNDSQLVHRHAIAAVEARSSMLGSRQPSLTAGRGDSELLVSGPSSQLFAPLAPCHPSEHDGTIDSSSVYRSFGNAFTFQVSSTRYPPHDPVDPGA